MSDQKPLDELLPRGLDPEPVDGAQAAAEASEAAASEPLEAVKPADGAVAEPVVAGPAEPVVAEPAVTADEVEPVEVPPVEPEPPVEVPPVEPEPPVAPEPTVEPEPPVEVPPVEPEPPGPTVDRAPVPAPVDTTTLVPLEEIAPAIAAASVSRRAFLGFGLVVAGGLAGAAGLSRLLPAFEDSVDEASPIVAAYDPASKAWTFVVDTGSCIGCGLCVVACKEENDVPEEAAYTRTWVERHVTTSDGTMYVDAPEAGMYGFPPESTAPGAAGKTVTASHFEPRLCMQCENSPCTSVCPVGATYRTEDGVILVDARRCIGCGYCVVACPYGARYITPAGTQSPNDMPGVADKCTWCYHRISRGGKPACVEVCPVGARQFGDASDPDSEIATLIRERNPQMLNPEYGTRPRVLYLGPSIEEA